MKKFVWTKDNIEQGTIAKSQKTKSTILICVTIWTTDHRAAGLFKKGICYLEGHQTGKGMSYFFDTWQQMADYLYKYEFFPLEEENK